MAIYDFNKPSTFQTEQDVFFFLGRFPFGAQVEDLDIGAKGKVVDGTGSGADWSNKRVAVRDAEWKVKGHYAGDKGNVSWAMHWLFGRRDPIPCFGTFSGLDVGAAVHAMPATISDNSSKSSMNDSGKFDGQLEGRGASDLGYVMASPNATNVLTTTGTSTADDISALLPNGSYGGAFYIAILDIIGGTAPTIAMKMTHSTDGVASYVDLAPVATTILQSDKSTWLQYIEIPSTTLINPFTKLSWVTTGAPTQVQPLVVCARRPQRGVKYTGSN